MWTRALLGSLLLLSVACETKTEKSITVGTPKAADCDLTFDKLADSEWLYLRANPDKSETPDYHLRIKFFKEGEALKAKYNVGSVSAVYTFGCTEKGDELTCREDPKVKDWCQALEAGGAACNAEALRKIDPTLTDDQITDGMAKAEEVMKKFRNTPDWEKFKFQNNNLGNKLQGLLYVKVDKTACRLRITDNYMTIYNGKKVEDSNPSGTNPWVKSTEGDLLWEHCEDSEEFIATTSADRPDPRKVGHLGKHALNSDVHWWYIGADGLSPAEGCSYSYDVYVDAKPAQKDVAVEAVAGKKGQELNWHWTQKADKPGVIPVTLIRSKACNGGAKEKVEVDCNVIQVE